MIELWDGDGGRWGRSGTDAEGRVLVRRREAARRARRGAALRRARLRARPAAAPADADLLPGRSRRRTPPIRCSRRSPRPTARRWSRAEDGAACDSISVCRANGRPSSSRVSPFAAIFVPEAAAEAVSDRAWLDAMLDAERALVNAGSLAGFVPADAAATVAAACDADALRRRSSSRVDGRAAGNPVEPLVRALRGAGRRRARGARSPRRDEPGHPRHGGDARRARASLAIDDELDGAAAVCAELAAGAPRTR